MTNAKLRIASAITGLSLLAGGAGVASFAQIASAQAGGPTVTLSSTTGSTTAATTIPVTVAFSEAVTGFTSSDVTLGGTASSSVSNFQSTGTTTYSFNVNLSSGGTVSVAVPADVASSTATSTSNQASNVLNFTAGAATISNITVSNIGTSSATISWNTNTSSTGQVEYGTTTSYGSVQTAGTSSTTQSVNLTNLQSGTLYHFRVVSNNGLASTTSADQTFVTTSTSTSTPLAVTSIDAIKTNGIADNTFQNGWEWVLHFTVPDNENAFRIRFSDWTMVGSSTVTFPANGNIRLSIAQSSNASTTGSSMVSSGTGYSDWFYLSGDTSSSTPGRQVDLRVEVKIPVGTVPGAYSTNFTAQTFPSTATSTATSTSS